MPVWGIWKGARGAMGHCTGRSHRIGARVHPGPAQLPTNRGSTDAERRDQRERAQGKEESRLASPCYDFILLTRPLSIFPVIIHNETAMRSAFKMYPDDGSFLHLLGSRPPSSLTWMMAATSPWASLLGLPDFVSHPS